MLSKQSYIFLLCKYKWTNLNLYENLKYCPGVIVEDSVSCIVALKVTQYIPLAEITICFIICEVLPVCSEKQKWDPAVFLKLQIHFNIYSVCPTSPWEFKMFQSQQQLLTIRASWPQRKKYFKQLYKQLYKLWLILHLIIHLGIRLNVLSNQTLYIKWWNNACQNGACFVTNLKKQTDAKNSRIIEKSFSDISRTNLWMCVFVREEDEREGREKIK